jgi:hypothetical protein
MLRVKAREKSNTKEVPSTLAAYIPASVAPAVFAIVLRMRIAVMGILISSFIASKRRAKSRCFPVVFTAARVPLCVEYNIASSREQKAEIQSVRKITTIKIIIDNSWTNGP